MDDSLRETDRLKNIGGEQLGPRDCAVDLAFTPNGFRVDRNGFPMDVQRRKNVLRGGAIGAHANFGLLLQCGVMKERQILLMDKVVDIKKTKPLGGLGTIKPVQGHISCGSGASVFLIQNEKSRVPRTVLPAQRQAVV